MKHYEKAKFARGEYEMLTGVKPPYPRSTKDLNKLLSDVEFRRLGRILEDDEPARPPPPSLSQLDLPPLS